MKEDADPFARFYRQPAPFRPGPPAEGRSAAWFLENTKKLKLDEKVHHGEREERARADGELPYRYRDPASRPELAFDKIVFVKRFTYHSSHFYTDFLDGSSRFGGNISLLDLGTGEVKDLFPADGEMAGGIFGRFTLSFDARKLVFDWKKAPIEGFRPKNIRTREPMHFVTWWVDLRQEPGYNHFLGRGWMRHQHGPLYMDPHPLAEDLFLVSHNRDRAWTDPTAYELMLLDESGNHWPILASDGHSLWQPTPLVPRKRPPVIPSNLAAM